MRAKGRYVRFKRRALACSPWVASAPFWSQISRVAAREGAAHLVARAAKCASASARVGRLIMPKVGQVFYPAPKFVSISLASSPLVAASKTGWAANEQFRPRGAGSLLAGQAEPVLLLLLFVWLAGWLAGWRALRWSQRERGACTGLWSGGRSDACARLRFGQSECANVARSADCSRANVQWGPIFAALAQQ